MPAVNEVYELSRGPTVEELQGLMDAGKSTISPALSQSSRLYNITNLTSDSASIATPLANYISRDEQTQAAQVEALEARVRSLESDFKVLRKDFDETSQRCQAAEEALATRLATDKTGRSLDILIFHAMEAQCKAKGFNDPDALRRAVSDPKLKDRKPAARAIYNGSPLSLNTVMLFISSAKKKADVDRNCLAHPTVTVADFKAALAAAVPDEVELDEDVLKAVAESEVLDWKEGGRLKRRFSVE
ncbi:hypothetical protein FB451DRAFT_1170756 [Mycena latifolia]|nr:hypothetical protein FB451DRAFT_1170756 [Mycena latifolia]